MAGPAPPTLTLCTILWESKRIINAHSRHFLALSVIFLLPLSFSITVYPTLQSLLITSTTINRIPQSQFFFTTLTLNIPSPKTDAGPTETAILILSLSYSLFLLTFSLLSLSSLTYSTFHAFFGRPVKLLASLRHSLLSFLPLLATTLLAQLLITALLLVVAGLFWVLLAGFRFFGFSIAVDSVWVEGICAIAGVCLLVLLVWVQVRWILGFVVVVVESSWGIEPLRRSSWLISGFKRVGLSMVLFFGVLGLALVGCSYVFASTVGEVRDGWWKSWVFVLQIVVTTVGLSLVFLFNSAAATVLYMYCKAVHGELAWEIAQEFSSEYVCLPFDDGKVPHVVSIIYP